MNVYVFVRSTEMSARHMVANKREGSERGAEAVE